MSICKALKKYGHSNFSLEILEYCEPKDAIKKEQDYLDLLEPNYNILKKAGSSLGYKHTETTLAKLSSFVFTEEHRAKLRAARAHRITRDETRVKMVTAKGSGAVVVTDLETNQTVEYISMSETARALNTNHVTIGRYIKSQKV